jgi:hypothetical protein
LFAWLEKFHVHPPAELADAVEAIAPDAEWRFELLYRGYACYADFGSFSCRPGPPDACL